MADEQQQGERSEEPTERKIEKGREEGQVPRSRELVTMALLASALISFWLSGSLMRDQLFSVMKSSFQFQKEALHQKGWLHEHLVGSLAEGFSGLFPFMAIVTLATVAASAALGGWIFSNKLLQPKLERVSFIKGIKRMFSANSAMELVKSIAKLLLLSLCLWLTFQWFFTEVLQLNRLAVFPAILLGVSYLMKAVILMVVALTLICFVDVPFQRWNHTKKLRMTHKEIKDETKESEGQPEVRSRLREKQQEMASRRMMQAVPMSDVVITNPTHFAVAIRYDQDRAKAPYLVAKGIDQTALRICAVAREYNKPVIQSPVLARVVYHTTKLNQEVPDELYLAVAQVLAYVHHLNEYQAGRLTKAPDLPAPEVSREFRDKWDKSL